MNLSDSSGAIGDAGTGRRDELCSRPAVTPYRIEADTSPFSAAKRENAMRRVLMLIPVVAVVVACAKTETPPADTAISDAALMVTHSMEQVLEQGDRTIMVHRGEVLADLSGSEREGLDAGDLLKRFTELKYTVEFAVASRPQAM